MTKIGNKRKKGSDEREKRIWDEGVSRVDRRKRWDCGRGRKRERMEERRDEGER